MLLSGNNIQLYTILYVTRVILLPRFWNHFRQMWRSEGIPRLQSWNILLQRLTTVQLSQGSDVFRWNLHGNGKFSVDSMYRALIQSGVAVNNNKKIWKMKIPLKNKIFAWYLRRGVILNKDNLIKWKPAMCLLSSWWDNKIFILPMQIGSFYMVSHPDSFWLISSL